MKGKAGKALLTLRPGDPGTHRWEREYGERLVAVRYRYDETRWKRVTTVEVVVDEVGWTPEKHFSDPDRLVGLRIGYGEEELRRRVRGAGGRWDPEARLWWLRLGLVTQLALEERIAAWSPVEQH